MVYSRQKTCRVRRPDCWLCYAGQPLNTLTRSHRNLKVEQNFDQIRRLIIQVTSEFKCTRALLCYTLHGERSPKWIMHDDGHEVTIRVMQRHLANKQYIYGFGRTVYPTWCLKWAADDRQHVRRSNCQSDVSLNRTRSKACFQWLKNHQVSISRYVSQSSLKSGGPPLTLDPSLFAVWRFRSERGKAVVACHCSGRASNDSNHGRTTSWWGAPQQTNNATWLML
jgi:hypothetical protein